MQFPAADEEDGDFMVPGSSRSRLSSLFQRENASGDINQALTFTAPKQPKKNDNAQGASAALKLIHAVVVHAYKLKDGNYSTQGKLGCVILGHHETCSYKLLLYKGKQMQVTVAAIMPSFIFHVQPNNYANFYDEKKENWSINFESEAALFDFTKQIALAKANAQGKTPNALVMQDLVNGDGQALETGDTAEVKYTGWLLANFTFGQVFDSNMSSESLYRVKLGKSKVIKGWTEGLPGIQKSGRRLLIIPPELAYGSEGMGSAVPPNSTLIFEIHVLKVKLSHESSHSPSPVKAPELAKPDVPPRQSFSQEDNIKMRGASISEQLTQSPKKDKAQLISRMAKMGTATLPFQGAVAAQVSSDSDSEVEAPQPSSPAPQPSSPAPHNVSRTSSPKPVAKPRSRTHSGSVASNQPPQTPVIQGAVPFQQPSQPSSQTSMYDPSLMPTQSPMVCAATPFSGYPSQLPSQYSMLQSSFSMQNVPTMVPSVQTAMVDSHLPLLVTESRNQNMEVRICLSKITDKVDAILNKVDDMRLQGRSASTHMPFMEGATLLQNIERIVQENSRLKEEAEVKDSKIQSLNEKVYDLFQRNQRFFEESSTMLEQKSGSMQAASVQSQEKILNLEQEKARLQLDLSTTTIKLNTLQEDLGKHQRFESELHQKLSDTEAETKKRESLLNDTNEQLSEVQNKFSSMTEKLRHMEQEKNLLMEKIQSLEQGLNSSQEIKDLVEMYKKEAQQYKEKIEEMESARNNDTSAAQLENEIEKIRLELTKNIKLKNEMEVEIKELHKKLNSNEELKASLEEKIRKLEAEVENSQILKRKYEVFQEKTRALKDRYEKQIIELMNEVKHLQAAKSVGIAPEFSAEIKKVMNMLYKLLQGKFDSNTSYSGTKISETVLQTIMGLTFKILEKKNQPSSDHVTSLEPSEKENVLKQEETNSVETSQAEFSQQNGIQVEETKTSKELSSNPVTSDEEQFEEASNIVKEENIPASKDSNESVNQNIPELAVNRNTEDAAKLENASKVQVGENTKAESPESNIDEPSSSLFSETLSGTNGTKV